MSELNRQQICAALSVSESTIRRLEQHGLPYTPVGVRSKRYDLAECKKWLKENQPWETKTQSTVVGMAALRTGGSAFTESCRKIRLRVTPS
jgi:hypothetical protein